MVTVKKNQGVNPDTLAPELRYEVTFALDILNGEHGFEGEAAHDIATLHRLLDKLSAD
jgi:hypothetical protein